MSAREWFIFIYTAMSTWYLCYFQQPLRWYDGLGYLLGILIVWAIVHIRILIPTQKGKDDE